MAAAIVITRDAAAFSKNNPTVDITLKLKYTILKIDIVCLHIQNTEKRR